ncbi:unnamed protein product [Protopolystoma xenopodis]|uniref:Uncharacterized protein n=1 Tax=Protopolystoma xenopodis TaxID=117903 RepID=A0A3S5CF34_9PLAT|nr:unnamed protein product [Protopolystoma xenopodis]
MTVNKHFTDRGKLNKTDPETAEAIRIVSTIETVDAEMSSDRAGSSLLRALKASRQEAEDADLRLALHLSTASSDTQVKARTIEAPILQSRPAGSMIRTGQPSCSSSDFSGQSSHLLNHSPESDAAHLQDCVDEDANEDLIKAISMSLEQMPSNSNSSGCS